MKKILLMLMGGIFCSTLALAQGPTKASKKKEVKATYTTQAEEVAAKQKSRKANVPKQEVTFSREPVTPRKSN